MSTQEQGAADMPPLPPKRRRFFCTKCAWGKVAGCWRCGSR